MKVILFLFSASCAVQAAELPVGSISANQTFAVRSGSGFINSSLDAYQGKILVIMMQTPWCPGCLSNSAAVGDGILDHFNAASRGALRGKNAHGIEIDSIMLSVEPAAGWDANNASFASTNGYEQWGLDANAQRQSPRVMLGYFRGGYPNNINSSNLYDWGEDRRRVVILNLVKGSASHDYREIVLNQNYFSSVDAADAQSQINAIAPAPTYTSYANWSLSQSFPVGKSGPNDDPDLDGCVNLMEFFHGTHPLQAASRYPGPSLTREGNTMKIVYRRARNIGGFTVDHRTSDGVSGWQSITLTTPLAITAIGDVDEVSVTLPVTADATRFYQLAVSL